MPHPPEPPDFPASQMFLRRLAYSLVRDAAQAEDLVQETWAAWVEHKPRGLAEPRAWLARVLRNRAFNQKRADERRARREGLAGRPDPSAPETDGTLEAQAQLLEALRKLEEPYRSTLVQRYYHDLAPSAIAERSGAPLNTVKARLARGLDKLRAEMDRRYRGDRRAWCHWLAMPGAPPLVAPPQSGTLTGVGSSIAVSPLAWTVTVGALVGAAALWNARTEEARTRTGPPPQITRRERMSGVEALPIAETKSKEVAREDGALGPLPERARLDPAPVRVSPGPDETALEHIPVVDAALPFEWPQYGGGPTHDNFREAKDGIHSPRVLWFVPGCAGQPTLDGDDLYTGGLGLASLDLDTGLPRALAIEILGVSFTGKVDLENPTSLVEALARVDERTREGVAETLANLDPNDPELLAIAPAPVVLPELVLARRAQDGGVSAFDRGLEEEVWRWDPGWDTRSGGSPAPRVPLCLTDDGLVLVALHDELYALRASDGRVRWRYSVEGAIEMVPAESRGRVFFGTDRGLFVALSVKTGERIWQVRAEPFGACAPVVVEGRVFAADHPGAWRTRPSYGAKLYAWNVSNGMPLWESSLFRSRPPTGLGVDDPGRFILAPTASTVVRYDQARGGLGFDGRLRTEGYPQGTPVVVGGSLVFAQEGGRLRVSETEGKRRLRWAFQLPEGAEVQDFVATGDRIYLATSIGLFCLANDPSREPNDEDFILEWTEDPRTPRFAANSAREDE